MPVNRARFFPQRIFEAGQLSSAFQRIVDELPDDPDRVHLQIDKRLEDGTNSSSKASFRELDEVCDLRGLSVHLFLQGEGYLAMSVVGDDCRVYVAAADVPSVTKIFELLQSSLDLQFGEPKKSRALRDRLAGLEQRVSALENTAGSLKQPLQCFFSYRFSERADVYASSIQQFFSMVDVSVLTGASYEPRSISEKVLDRLSSPLDFIVILVTRDGESMWTRDEIAVAHHRKIPVIPIVESGGSFDQGLFGDLEYIPFESGHISDAFLKLFQALTFLRSQGDLPESEEE